MTKGVRAAIAFVGAAVVAGIIAFAAVVFTSYPPSIAATRSGNSANLTLQTVAQLGYGQHFLWVSYLARNQQGKWEQSTIYHIPAHSTIHVTVYQFDTQGPLRNAAISQVQGVDGGVEYVNGHPLPYVNPNGDTAPAHTFTVPDLGISVPLVGINPNAKNQCSQAPCNTSQAHNTITFTFHTGAPGIYRWQCFVPCGLGYLNGNGGPMSTLGFMGGFLDVENA